MSSAFTILNKPPLPCSTCPAECCTAIPLTPSQFKRICRALKALPPETFERLQKQRPAINQCMLLDLSNYRCSVYNARPPICEIFGRHPRGICTHAPERSDDLTPREAAAQMVDMIAEGGATVGLTGITFYPHVAHMTKHVLTWGDFKAQMEKL